MKGFNVKSFAVGVATVVAGMYIYNLATKPKTA